MRQSVFRTQTLGGTDRILTGTCQFLQVIVVARTLGPGLFGEYSVIWGIATVCLGVASGFLWTPLIKFSAGLDQNDASVQSSPILTFGILFYLVLGLLAAGLWGGLAHKFSNTSSGSTFLFLPLVLFSRFYYDYSRCVFIARSSLGLMLSIDVIFNLVLLLSLLGFGLFVGSVSVTSVLLCYVAAGVTASLFGLSQYRPGIENWSTQLARDVRRFAVVSGANSLLLYLYSQADVLLAGLLLLPASVGLYSGGRSLVRVGYMAIEALNAMSLATASAFVNRTNSNKLFRYVYSLVLIGWCITVPAAVFLIIGSTPLVKVVFGEAYVNSAQIASILCLGFLFFAVSNPTASALDALGKPVLSLMAKAVGLGTMLVTAPFLVERSSAKGIAWASVAGIGVIALIQAISFLRSLNQKLAAQARSVV